MISISMQMPRASFRECRIKPGNWQFRYYDWNNILLGLQLRKWRGFFPH